MKRLLLASSLILGLCQAAIAADSSQLIGRWKMTDYKCASGKKVNFFSDAISNFKIDLVLTVVSNDRAEAKVDYSYAFKSDYVRKHRKSLTDALAQWKAQPATPELTKLIADYTKVIADFDKNTQPQSCSNITRMTYYLRNNTFYTNDLNNLSTCTKPGDNDGSEDDSSGPSTLELKGNQLIMTDSPELEKGSTCPVNDRVVMTLVRE